MFKTLFISLSLLSISAQATLISNFETYTKTEVGKYVERNSQTYTYLTQGAPGRFSSTEAQNTIQTLITLTANSYRDSNYCKDLLDEVKYNDKNLTAANWNFIYTAKFLHDIFWNTSDMFYKSINEGDPIGYLIVNSFYSYAANIDSSWDNFLKDCLTSAEKEQRINDMKLWLIDSGALDIALDALFNQSVPNVGAQYIKTQDQEYRKYQHKYKRRTSRNDWGANSSRYAVPQEATETDNDEEKKSERFLNAAKEGNIEKLKELLSKERKTIEGYPEIIQEFGRDALKSVLKNKDLSEQKKIDTIKLLLENNAHIQTSEATTEQKFRQTPPEISVETFRNIWTNKLPENPENSVQKLILINSFINSSETPLITAVSNNDKDLTKSLLENGALASIKNQRNGFNAFCMAARLGYTDIMDLLLKSVQKDDKQKDYLLNSKDQKGNTALMRAVEKKQPKAVQWLISKGADATIKFHDDSAIFIAVQKGYNDILKLLLQSVEKDKNKKNLLLDLKDDSGNTALIKAVQANNVEAVQLLTENGANTSDSNCEIFIAARKGYNDIIKILLEHDLSLIASTMDDGTGPYEVAPNMTTKTLLKHYAEKYAEQ